MLRWPSLEEENRAHTALTLFTHDVIARPGVSLSKVIINGCVQSHLSSVAPLTVCGAHVVWCEI